MQFDEELIRKIEIEFNTNCIKCGVDPSVERGYCLSCLEDLISKSLAAQIIGCTVQKLEKVTVYYKELLPQYSFGNQVRLSRNDVMVFATSHPDINTVKYKWSNHALKCRLCKTTDKPHFGGGYCADCYKDSKEFTTMNGYMFGENLSELGDAMGITRERTRQLFERALKIETERTDPDKPQLSVYELKEQLKKIHKRNRAKRDFKEVIESDYDSILRRLSDISVKGEKGLLKTLDMPLSVLPFIKQKYPEFIEIVNHNGNRWTLKYDSCRMCNTSTIKHKRWGYCADCYTKSEEWRDSQYKYRQNHLEEFKERTRIYSAAYSKRPEVKERMRLRTHDKNFDGNRELAFEVHGAYCSDCGISRDDFKAIASKDLPVYRIDGDHSNNEVSNLRPLCFSCLAKRTKTQSNAF